MKKELLFILLMAFGAVMSHGQDVASFSADAFYNQGNEAYNNGQYGDAVYFFEKSLILDPNASDTKINLELSKERLDADIVELDSFFLAQWWSGFANLFLPGTWKVISVLFLIGLLTLLYFFFFGKRELSKSKVYTGFGVLSILMLLSILAGNSRYNAIFNSPYAVVSGDAQTLYLGPDEVSEKIKPVVSGVKVKVIDEDNDWYKVSTMDSEQGWIKKNEVKLLKF